MMFTRHAYPSSMALGLLGLVTACGAGAAGKAVRPDDPTAAQALGDGTPGTVNCTKAPARGETLVVDWKTNDQLDLAVALKNGIAVVSYDCKSIRLLQGCSAKGKYGFTPVS